MLFPWFREFCTRNVIFRKCNRDFLVASSHIAAEPHNVLRILVAIPILHWIMQALLHSTFLSLVSYLLALRRAPFWTPISREPYMRRLHNKRQQQRLCLHFPYMFSYLGMPRRFSWREIQTLLNFPLTHVQTALQTFANGSPDVTSRFISNPIKIVLLK